MTINLDIKDQYLSNFENFIKSLPKDAIKIQNSLDKEIETRVKEYQSGKMETISHEKMWESINQELNR